MEYTTSKLMYSDILGIVYCSGITELIYSDWIKYLNKYIQMG
jgi:hypothetical protein